MYMQKKRIYNTIFDPFRSRRIKHLLGDSISIRQIDVKKYVYIPKKIPPQTIHNKYDHYFNNNLSKIYSARTINVSSNIPQVSQISSKIINTKAPEVLPEIKKEITESKIKPEEKFNYHIITDKTSFIQFPEPNYGTNDKDLKTLIDIFNEKPTNELGYSKEIDEPDIKAYQKLEEGKDIVLIKSISNIPYNKYIIFEAIANLELRKKWDKSFEELKIVNHDGENGAEILYMIIKPPVFFITPREIVQQRKIWKNFPTTNSHIMHFISVDNPACPVNKKYVRAKTIISGYYIQDDPNRPGCSILGSLSQTDVGGKIPVGIINKFAAKSSKNWVDNLKEGCKMVFGNK